jgi:hypothetical protein
MRKYRRSLCSLDEKTWVLEAIRVYKMYEITLSCRFGGEEQTGRSYMEITDLLSRHALLHAGTYH